MAEYAPSAIHSLYDAISFTGKQFSGILGDAEHTYGYHRARACLTVDDYSVKLPPDRLGSPWAASALDVKLSTGQMILATTRLLVSAKAGDPRLHALREFGGTTDGKITHSFDLFDRHEGLGEWDDTHLWHLHLSIYREHSEDPARLAPIADVINGVAPDPWEELMSLYPDRATFEAALASIVREQLAGWLLYPKDLGGDDKPHGVYRLVDHAIRTTPPKH